VDPDGLIGESIWDAVSLGTGIYSFIDNVKNGRGFAAAIDAVGIVADAAALAAPFVPGGVGTAIKAVRAANTLGKITDAAKVTEGIIDTAAAVKENDVPGIAMGLTTIAATGVGIAADRAFGVATDATKSAKNAAAIGAIASWGKEAEKYGKIGNLSKGAKTAMEITELAMRRGGKED
jgi:hypothetical protein